MRNSNSSTPDEMECYVQLKHGPRFCKNFPFGSCHFLILSLPPDANVNCRGCDTIARMLFLWWVSVDSVLPAARSHN